MLSSRSIKLGKRAVKAFVVHSCARGRIRLDRDFLSFLYQETNLWQLRLDQTTFYTKPEEPLPTLTEPRASEIKIRSNNILHKARRAIAYPYGAKSQREPKLSTQKALTVKDQQAPELTPMNRGRTPDILHIYIVLEYHMEFLETFECIWSTKESDRMKSLAFSRPETHRFDPGATSQSDVPKSLPMFRATYWSDTPRSLASSRPETPKSSILERPLSRSLPARATSQSDQLKSLAF
ncbi:hypothetical protein DY000_02041316 [Brassica cretica]|uniref:Uncharacterized protein n=1 Tax=Brassica cretica TaxID=69181 RepID=A0ABQ7BDC6_BRACR|nr:hypothetical protein DY000_02041316 [Brassica cretica]